MKFIFFFLLTFSALASPITDWLKANGGNGGTAHDLAIANAPQVIGTKTNAATTTTNTASNQVIGEAQHFAELCAIPDVATVIAAAGIEPDKIEAYLKVHSSTAETRENFRTMRDIWKDIAPFCPNGSITSFSPQIVTTNAAMTEPIFGDSKAVQLLGRAAEEKDLQQ